MIVAHLDGWLLDRFQVLSDWIHEWTGFDCIIQSRVCAALAAACWLALIVWQQMARQGFDWMAAVCLLSQLSSAFWESDGDAAARQAGAHGFRNPRRVQWIDLCFRCMLGVVIFIFFALHILTMRAFASIDGVLLSSWLRLVLSSCDVQTPRVGRIREFLMSMGKRLIPAEVRR